jgi:hypothetical protein
MTPLQRSWNAIERRITHLGHNQGQGVRPATQLLLTWHAGRHTTNSSSLMRPKTNWSLFEKNSSCGE